MKSVQDTATKSLWGEYEIPTETALHWEAGDLNLWCIKDKSEIKAAYHYTDDEAEARTEQDGDCPGDKWLRWTHKREHKKIRLTPSMPNYMIVVKPESDLRLVPGAQCRVFIRIPLWINIETVGKNPHSLLNIPLVILSKTWFGSLVEGEPAFWISSGIRREANPDPSRPYLAICPVNITNKSNEDLIVEKIGIRVDYLTLYKDGSQLWTDDLKVSFRGRGEISQIAVSSKPPAESSSAVQITGSRLQLKKMLAIKSFSRLKDLPSLGFHIT